MGSSLCMCLRKNQKEEGNDDLNSSPGKLSRVKETPRNIDENIEKASDIEIKESEPQTEKPKDETKEKKLNFNLFNAIVKEASNPYRPDKLRNSGPMNATKLRSRQNTENSEPSISRADDLEDSNIESTHH